MSAGRSPGADIELTATIASDLARRALRNIGREYPNHPQYLLECDADAVPPRVLHPIFFGCFDWHSAVHTHWLLVRLLATVPGLEVRASVEAALDAAFVADKARVEADYLARRPWFERPYGLAWLMLLIADSAATRWAEALEPLAAAARTNVLLWLSGLRYAVRCGTHTQTAFALTLLHDAARASADDALENAVAEHALRLFANDANAALHLEPSGEDFLSATLTEADLMRRVLSTTNFAAWLERWLPRLPYDADEHWLPCAIVDDETDGRRVHLHGLNLSRAWNLAHVAAALPLGDPRIPPLAAAARAHRAAGIAATLAAHDYAGDHWLPSFAVYLLTDRGR